MDLHSLLGQGNAQKKIFVGMEIDDYEIRAIEVDMSDPTPRLLQVAKLSLPEGLVSEGIVKNPIELGKELKKLHENHEFSSDKIYLSIGHPDVLIRFQTIPQVEDSIMKDYIRSQSGEYFPVSINDYEMDFMQLEKRTAEGHSEVDVIIVAARNSLIRGYTAAIENSGLNPYEIDVSPLSTMCYAESTYSDSTVIIANICYGKLDLLIVKNCIPAFAKTTFFDASGMLETKNPTLSGPTSQLFADITYEIKALVNYCFSLHDGEPASAILLCGPGSRLDGLDLFISEQTRTNTVVINPFEQFFIPENIREKILVDASDYGICASVALRGLEG